MFKTNNISRYFILICALVLSTIYYGCGGSDQKDLTKAEEGDIPEWFINTPQDSNYLYAPTTASSQDMQLAIDKAVTAGRAEIGRTLELKMNGLQKKFEEEVGTAGNSTLLQQFTQAVKSVMSLTLHGSSVKEKKIVKDNNVWRAYVSNNHNRLLTVFRYIVHNPRF